MSEVNWSSWHVVLIEAVPDDDDEITVLHPEGCSLAIEVGGPIGANVRYSCLVGFEVENAGYGAFIDDCEPGWYRTRCRVVTIPNPTGWSEMDFEVETEKLEVAPRSLAVKEHE